MNALLPYWLHLTGGEQNCPRWRFALTMLAAYGLYHLLMPRFMLCALTLLQHGHSSSFSFGALILLIGIVLALVSLLLAFLPLSPLALLGVEVSLVAAYRLLQGNAPATPAPDSLWPYWLGITLSAPLLLLAGAVAFCAAWRRLRDAGRSPLFLLLGLTYLLGFGYDGRFAAEASGLYLLGPLWLIILYSQPSEGHRMFEIFRPLPAGNNTPAQKEAPTAHNKQGAQQKGEDGKLTSSQPSPGKNQSSAGTRPSPSNDAASYRRRMRARVQAARKRN